MFFFYNCGPICCDVGQLFTNCTSRMRDIGSLRIIQHPTSALKGENFREDPMQAEFYGEELTVSPSMLLPVRRCQVT